MCAARIARAAIKIPKRIERGPTDILKALASTVKHTTTGLEIHFHDDPFLIPSKSQDRAVFPLSRISGKCTARFLLNKHPELFYRDHAEPKIRSFLPPEEYREDMQFVVDDLKWCIENHDPVNGIIAYKALVEKNNVKLDDKLLLQFFELICFSNEDPLYDLIEHQKLYYSRDVDKLAKQNWRRAGLASKIFNQIKQDVDPPRVYSAMIAGLIKHNEHQTAKEIFDEFREFHPQHGLFVEAYDSLILSVPNLNSSFATAHNAVDEIIKHMEEHLVVPDLRVFNSILDVYKRFNCDADVCHKVFQLMTDMRLLQIEPSPYTYNCFTSILVKSKEFRNHPDLIKNLLLYILGHEEALKIRDARDTQFLIGMINMTAGRLNNLEITNILFKIYLKQPTLFPSVSLRSLFFELYFRLLLSTEKLETILSFYETYVPSMFRLNADTYDAFIETLDLYQADEETIKKIGKDVLKFKMGDKIKNDAIFRKDPDYVKELGQMMGLE